MALFVIHLSSQLSDFFADLVICQSDPLGLRGSENVKVVVEHIDDRSANRVPPPPPPHPPPNLVESQLLDIPNETHS